MTTITIYFFLDGEQHTHQVTDDKVTAVATANIRMAALRALGAKRVHVSMRKASS